MKHIEMSQNWLSVIGFRGEAKYGYKTNGKDFIYTDYVEIRLDPEKEHSLYELIDYTEEDWKNDYPNAEKYILVNGKWDGDYRNGHDGFTMKESVDRIIAYVHFNHDGHDFNKVFFECGSIDSREDVEAEKLMTQEEMNKLIEFARECLKNDITKANKNSRWMYSEYYEDRVIPEDTKMKW